MKKKNKGLSIDPKLNEDLEKISKKYGKTKSQIVNEAIKFLNNKHYKKYDIKERFNNMFGFNALIDTNEKIKRIKIGVMLEDESLKILDFFAKKATITLSEVFEDAIRYRKANEIIMDRNIQLLDSLRELTDDEFNHLLNRLVKGGYIEKENK